MALLLDASTRNNILPVYLELQARKAEYLASREWRVAYYSPAELVNSWIGDYRTALVVADEAPSSVLRGAMFREEPHRAESMPDTGVLREMARYRPANAVTEIVRNVKMHNVLMINEEHFIPMHRAFTTELLPVLWEQGFRYFAAETFDNAGFDLNSARYPSAKMGFFVRDPVFGDMVRRAKEIGFTLIPY